MNKGARLVFGSLFSLFLLCGCEKKDDDKFVIGLSADYAPFEYQSDDQNHEIIGFDVDIAREIAKDMGKELVIKEMPLYSLITALKHGNIECIISGISPTKEREKEVSFSDIYYKSKMGFLVDQKALLEAGGPKNLLKKSSVIGVQTGTVMQSYVADSDYFAEATAISQDSNLQLVALLKKGLVKAVLLDLDQAIVFAEKENLACIYLDDKKFSEQEYGFAAAVSPHNQEMLKKINDSIARMKSDGTMETIAKKFLNRSGNQDACIPFNISENIDSEKHDESSESAVNDNKESVDRSIKEQIADQPNAQQEEGSNLISNDVIDNDIIDNSSVVQPENEKSNREDVNNIDTGLDYKSMELEMTEPNSETEISSEKIDDKK